GNLGCRILARAGSSKVNGGLTSGNRDVVARWAFAARARRAPHKYRDPLNPDDRRVRIHLVERGTERTSLLPHTTPPTPHGTVHSCYGVVRRAGWPRSWPGSSARARASAAPLLDS